MTADAGIRIREARRKKGWTLRELASRSGMALGSVHSIESGEAGSLDSYCRIGAALGLRPEIEFVDPRRYRGTGRDIVHAAMGEIETARFQSFQFATSVDEPYQHYQFAGRADVVAWDVASRAMIHIENRTMFPDIQEAAGAWNAKRSWLPPELARRLELPSWASVTNVMVGVWSAELLSEVRRHAATFRAICPGDGSAFAGWWRGDPPPRGVFTELVLLDPAARPGVAEFAVPAGALSLRPRHARYADIARKLRA